MLRQAIALPVSCCLLLAACIACSTLPSKEELPSDSKIKQTVDYSRLGDESLKNHDYPQAINFYELALEINYSLDNLIGIAESQMALGNVAVAQKNFKEADRLYSRAWANGQASGNAVVMARIKSNMGKLALSQGQATEALAIFQAAKDLSGTNETELTAVIFHNMAVALDDLNRIDESVQYLKKALAINTGKKQLRESASNNYMLASISSRQGKYAEAITLMETALALDKQTEFSEGIAKDLFGLYSIHLKTGKEEPAYQYLSRSFYVSLNTNDESAVRQALPLLKNLALKIGKTAEAVWWDEALVKLDAATKTTTPAGGKK